MKDGHTHTHTHTHTHRWRWTDRHAEPTCILTPWDRCLLCSCLTCLIHRTEAESPVVLWREAVLHPVQQGDSVAVTHLSCVDGHSKASSKHTDFQEVEEEQEEQEGMEELLLDGGGDARCFPEEQPRPGRLKPSVTVTGICRGGSVLTIN